MHCLQHRFPYQYSHIYSTRGLRSIQCCNQCLKYYSSSTFKWRQNQTTFTFFLEIVPHTCYDVSDVASVLLLMIQLKELYSTYLLQCYITGTWFNPMTHDEQNDRESMLMLLLFTSFDNNLWSSKSFQEGSNWMEDLKICQKPTKYGQVMCCEAGKVDMANSKDS